MMAIPMIGMIAEAFAGVIAFIIRHPFVAKMMIFSLFLVVIGAGVSYIQDLVAPYIVNNALLGFAAFIGVIDGISIYLTIVLAGFGVKQVLAFIRS